MADEVKNEELKGNQFEGKEDYVKDVFEEIAEYYESEEDLLTYALFPQLAIPFFKRRQAAKYGIDKTVYDKDNQVHPV